MPTKISDVKAAKIMHHYFTGMPQPKIAQKCHVNQSTVSRCAKKFEEEASAKGIVSVAKEHQIMSEVTALRSLAVDLYKSKVSIEEAKSGAKMVALFHSLDVPPEDYKVLAKILKKLKDPEFYKVGMKLVKLEESTGKDYNTILGEFEQMGEEIAVRQEAIADLKEKQAEEEVSHEKLKLDLKEKEAELMEYLKEAEEKKAVADAEVKEKLAEAGLTLEKIDKVHPTVEKMNVLGITDDKFETFVKEHQVLEEQGITWEKFQAVAQALAKAGEDISGEGLAAKLKEYGTLNQAITSIKDEKASLQPEVEKLGGDKIKLMVEVDGLVNSKAKLETEVQHLEELKKALEGTIDTLEIRRNNLEKHLAELENDIADQTVKKAAVTEEVNQKQLTVSELEEKLKKADAISQTLVEKQVEFQELEVKKAAAGQKYELFEAFLGLVAGKSTADAEHFHISAEALINEANSGNYDYTELLYQVIDQFTGGALDLIGCPECDTEFIIVKSSKKQLTSGISLINRQCPICGGIHTVIKKKLLVPALKKVIVSQAQIVLEKPGEITSEDKTQEQD